MKRLGSLLLVPIVFISLVSVSGSALFSTNASAADPIDNMSLDQKVQSYVYYYTLGNCLANGFLHDGGFPNIHQRINVGDITSGLWFAGSNQNGGGYLNGINGIKTSPDGSGQAGTVIDCEQTGLVKGALKLWNNWAPDEALCAFGYVRASGPASRCTDAQGGSDEFMKGGNVESAFKKAVADRIYGGKAPTLVDAAKYLLYLKAFQTACVPNANATTTPPTGNSNNDYAVKIVTGDGSSAKASFVYYTDYRNLTRDSTVYLYPNVYLSPPGAKQTCGDLVTAINDTLADKYVAYLVATGTKNTTPGGGGGCASGATTNANGAPCAAAGDEKSSCGIEGIGWIVCPVLTFLGSVTDQAFKFLSSTFLETKASVLNDPSVQGAWGVMRTVANIAFVIAFLFIIFSQLTGQGVSNYGVKKMLPRIVIAAILVNVSFYICQIAVDISNILGYSLNSALSGDFLNIGLAPGDNATGNGFGWTVIIAAVIAGSVTLLLAVTVPVLLAVCLALLMIVLILVARTALIILLTIVAPLAFVAFLLPNTEQWFKKWYKMYFALLMVFPVIAVVFGASTLAAGVINRAANGDIFMQVVAIGVAAIPLFVVPTLLKGSISAAGSIGAKLSGMTSKVNSGIRGKVRETSKLGQLQKYRTQQAQIRRSKILGGVDPRRGGRANPLNWSSRASRAFNDSRISGQFGNRATQMGDALAKEEFEKQVKEASISQDGVSLTELQVIATTGAGSDGRKVSEATRAAAIDKVMSTGGFNQRRDVLEAMASNKSTTSRTLRSRAVSAAYAKGDANIYGTQFGDNIVQETGTINSANDLADAAVANIAGGSLSAEHAVQGEGSTKYLVDTVVTKANAGDTIAQTARLRFKDVSSRAKVAESTRSKVTSAIDDAFTKL